MNKIYFSTILIFVSSFLFSQDNNHIPGNLLLMVGSDNEAKELQLDLEAIDGVKTEIRMERIISATLHIYLFSFDYLAINEEKILAKAKTHPKVKIAQYNHYINERNTVPNDPQYSVMWDMHNDGTNGGAGAVADADIDAPEAWDITTGGLTAEGDTIVVAVIDGGFSLTHPDLNFWKNYYEIPNNSIDDDSNGYVDDFDGWNASTLTDNWTPQSHGTHVAGTVGAKGDNGIGVTGVNWNVKVMPITYGSFSEANVVAAYAFARDQRNIYNQTNGAKGAFVVATNSSFGVDLASPSSYPLWCAMYDSLGAVGILSAGATANANYNVDTQGDIPTACPSNWLITVTNTKSNDTKGTAGYGLTTIDLGAPGTDITSTNYSFGSNTYSAKSGTSMATPHVAGTIGLLYSVACPQLISNYKADPAGIALMVKDSLLGAIDPVAALSGITVTGGRLNIFKSVKSMENYCIATGINSAPSSNDSNFEITNVYPNPAREDLTVIINVNEKADLVITNVLGQEVKKISVENSVQGKQVVRISAGDLGKGVYFVNLLGRNKKSEVAKVAVY